MTLLCKKFNIMGSFLALFLLISSGTALAQKSNLNSLEVVANEGWSCSAVSKFVRDKFFSYHILSATGEVKFDEILNSEERKKNVLQLFLMNLDPQKIAYSQEDFLKIEQQLFALDMADVKPLCALLENIYIQLKAEKSAKAKHLSSLLVSDAENIQSDVFLLEKAESEGKLDYREKAIEYSESYPLNAEDLKERLVFQIYGGLRSLTEMDEPSDRAYPVILRDLKFELEDQKEVDKNEFGLIVMKALAESIDIHNKIYSQFEFSEFRDSSSGSLSGVGAQVRSTLEGVKISKVISGGPLAKSGLIEDGDVITAIDGNSNWPLLPIKEVVKVLKGETGTVVNLEILKADGKKSTVDITRGRVATAANDIVSESLSYNGKKMGFLSFPSFFSSRGGQGVSSYVLNSLIDFIRDDVSGLVLDLRNNGGGSVREVINILGLFLGNNQVVMQTLDFEAGLEVFKTPNIPLEAGEIALFERPIVVLINESSASASEILSGNLKEYNRAIVLGSEQSFGKGVVQWANEISAFFPQSASWYSGYGMKVTASGYYLAGGETPQNVGVKPDVVISETRPGAVFEKDRNPLLKLLPDAPNRFESGESKKWLSDDFKNSVVEGVPAALENFVVDDSQLEDSENEVDEEKQKALHVLDYLVDRMNESIELKEAM